MDGTDIELLKSNRIVTWLELSRCQVVATRFLRSVWPGLIDGNPSVLNILSQFYISPFNADPNSALLLRVGLIRGQGPLQKPIEILGKSSFFEIGCVACLECPLPF